MFKLLSHLKILPAQPGRLKNLLNVRTMPPLYPAVQRLNIISASGTLGMNPQRMSSIQPLVQKSFFSTQVASSKLGQALKQLENTTEKDFRAHLLYYIQLCDIQLKQNAKHENAHDRKQGMKALINVEIQMPMNHVNRLLKGLYDIWLQATHSSEQALRPSYSSLIEFTSLKVISILNALMHNTDEEILELVLKVSTHYQKMLTSQMTLIQTNLLQFHPEDTLESLLLKAKILNSFGVHGLRRFLESSSSESLFELIKSKHECCSSSEFVTLNKNIDLLKSHLQVAAVWGIGGSITLLGQIVEIDGISGKSAFKLLQATCDALLSPPSKDRLVSQIKQETPTLTNEAIEHILHDAALFIKNAMPLTAFLHKDGSHASREKPLFNYNVIEYTGLPSHAVSFAHIDNRLYYSNRNDGGLYIFNYHNTGSDHLKKFKNIKELHDFLNHLTLIEAIPQKDQKAGNCVWISFKAMWFMALHISAKKHLSGHPNHSIYATQIAQRGKKAFSALARHHAGRQLLETTASQSHRLDPVFAEQLLNKAKKWECHHPQISNIIPPLEMQISTKSVLSKIQTKPPRP